MYNLVNTTHCVVIAETDFGSFKTAPMPIMDAVRTAENMTNDPHIEVGPFLGTPKTVKVLGGTSVIIEWRKDE